MINLILNFVTACRTSGLRVSTAEVIDSARQFELINLLDEDQFRTTLRANFAKSRREQRDFDRLYNLFFHDMLPDTDIDIKNPQKDEIRNALDQIKTEINEDPLAEAIFDFLAGDRSAEKPSQCNNGLPAG